MWGGSASQMRMWFGYGLQGCLYSHDRFWLGNWPVLFSVTFNQVGYTCSSTDSRCTAPVGKVLLESVKVREQIIKQTLNSLQLLLLSFLWLANHLHCLSCVKVYTSDCIGCTTEGAVISLLGERNFDYMQGTHSPSPSPSSPSPSSPSTCKAPPAQPMCSTYREAKNTDWTPPLSSRTGISWEHASR